jgi:hypothetical protein
MFTGLTDNVYFSGNNMKNRTKKLETIFEKSLDYTIENIRSEWNTLYGKMNQWGLFSAEPILVPMLTSHHRTPHQEMAYKSHTNPILFNRL